MIRIDEIYNHTFWPYLTDCVPDTRLFFCDPPGTSAPESLCNFGSNATDHSYLYCHDQEPLYLDIHAPLFSSVSKRNTNLNSGTGPVNSGIIVSELDSDSVDAVCEQYNWTPYYYFFHGWASLDWYRGYNRTFMMPDPHSRSISKSFVSPNRIIGGRRDHRVLLMYHLLNQQVSNALISFPLTCPQENSTVFDIADKHKTVYPNIVSTLESANFPWNMPNESGHPMHSCWLSLFEENAQSLIHVVTETSYFGRKWHLTEKTFKPICLQMPFVLVSNAGSLKYLRSYGFKTFDSIWDESYDDETNDLVRLEKIAVLLKQFDNMSATELQQMHVLCSHIVKHNYEHFYNGNFEKLLWKEFSTMLTNITRDFSA